MISLDKKKLQTFIKGAIAVMPAIPYFTKKKSSMLGAYVLGGIGVALVGGVAAVMFFSPRTRYRALDAAKSTYGKMSSQISSLRGEHASDGMSNGLSNGISPSAASSYSATGL